MTMCGNAAPENRREPFIFEVKNGNRDGSLRKKSKEQSCKKKEILFSFTPNKIWQTFKLRRLQIGTVFFVLRQTPCPIVKAGIGSVRPEKDRASKKRARCYPYP